MPVRVAHGRMMVLSMVAQSVPRVHTTPQRATVHVHHVRLGTIVQVVRIVRAVVLVNILHLVLMRPATVKTSVRVAMVAVREVHAHRSVAITSILMLGPVHAAVVQLTMKTVEHLHHLMRGLHRVR